MPAATNAVDAWRDLERLGGIELEGRDEDFVEALRRRLPSAPDLPAALERSTTDQFVRAFFELAEPYVQMFRAILEFFRKAGAAEGHAQWEIALNEGSLDLTEFERFLKSWTSVAADYDCPAIDFHGAWRLFQAGREFNLADDPLYFVNGRGSPPDDREVAEWLRAYATGEYPPLPASLTPARLDGALADAAAIVGAALATVRDLWGDRRRLMDYRTAAGFRTAMEDGLDPSTIAQNETDFCLGSSVHYLARATTLRGERREAFDRFLGEMYAPYPRRHVRFQANIPTFQRILSLPVWQRRHELYAVWTATEMVAALDDHVVVIHHEDGRIRFDFHETLVATIRSARPEVRIVSERKVALAEPVGKGRKGNVQPDYGIWRGTLGAERCDLVVEVKHYKRLARRSFEDVLTDYARAHQDAQVVLVSHGPAGKVAGGAASDVRQRCRALGPLTPLTPEPRAALKALVRDAVGPPVAAAPPPAGREEAVLLVDISGSMRTALEDKAFPALLERLLAFGIARVALADDRIRSTCFPDDARAALSKADFGTQTDLAAPVDELLARHDRLLVLTDEGGAADIPRGETLHWPEAAALSLRVLVLGG
jgi:hypothetical protein